ncbi:MAG: bifunctional nuclease family protein [Deltaproteobacteria bacterium]|nr:bifunctional nuclease family protein [Deltaproteobacteria bacterium]
MTDQPATTDQTIPEDEAVSIEFVTVASEEHGHKIVLKEKPDSQGQVEMFIGGSEFASIAKELGLIDSPRPLTHEVYFQLMDGLEVSFQRLEIYGLKENAYLARLYFTKKGQSQAMEIRPSDGVAMALRQKMPIVLNKRLLRGILSPQDRETLNDLVKEVKF